MHFGALLETMSLRADGYHVNPPENWRQGRTLYGGLTLALSEAAATRAFPGLPPLRAVQTAFIGPSAGEVTIHPTILRAGKSMTFIGVDLLAEGKLAARTLLAYGAARPSALAATAPPPPPVPAPDAAPPLFEGPGRPAFTVHLDQRFAGGHRLGTGAPEGDLLVWVRLTEPTPPSTAALLLLGDALPPASFPRFTTPTMISTVTWSFELFAPDVHKGQGWHLLRSTDDGVGEGYAGQSMAMWDEAGAPILMGRQSVAIFG
jgi:acyl-CoA thioesterase